MVHENHPFSIIFQYLDDFTQLFPLSAGRLFPFDPDACGMSFSLQLLPSGDGIQMPAVLMIGLSLFIGV